MPENITIKTDRLRKIVVDIFVKNGLSEAHAEMIADNLVEANARGVNSHGVLRVENYLNKIKLGSANPTPNIKTVHESPFSAVLDGDNGLGAVVGTEGMRVCRKKAEEVGIGCVAVRNSNHYGSAAYYCLRMAQDDMIAFSCSNVEPLMGPPGAKTVVIGNNPFCMAAPSGKYGLFCSDMATSQIALGKVLDHRITKTKLPGMYAIDADGNPTDDPDAAKFLMPTGLHKGYGIAYQLEILCSMLSGGHFGDQINSMYGAVDKPNNLSHYFMAVKISAFRDVAEFKADMDAMVEYVKSVPTKSGSSIIIPGEPEAASKERAAHDGVSIPSTVIADLVKWAYDSQDIEKYIH